MNFYDVLAAEKWDGGIPTINFFDLLFAEYISDGKWETYEGTLPATFNADGDDMRQYQVFGNTGGVGDATVNLFDYREYVYSYYISSSGVEVLSTPSPGYESIRLSHSGYISVSPDESYTMKVHHQSMNALQTVAIAWYDENKTFILRDSTQIPQKKAGSYNFTATAPQNAKFAIFNFFTDDVQGIMFIHGTTPPETFIPYGYEVDMGVKSANLFDKNATTDGYEIASGEIQVNERWCVSDFIPVESSTLYKSKNSGGSVLSYNDKSSQPTQLGGSINTIGVTTLPTTKFIKINCQISQKAVCMVSKSEDLPAEYQPYFNTTTPIYIGDEPLEKDEYVDYAEQKVYRMNGGVLTPTDPPVALPALPTCEGTTIVDYAGQSQAVPERVLLEYKKR